MLILGVDPGLSGAISLLDITDPKRPGVVLVEDMPTTSQTLKNGKSRRELDIYKLATTISMYSKDIRLAVLEDVSSMPNDGKVQAFRFGHSTGIITGIMAANLLPIQLVKPAVWKRLMGLSYDKNLSRSLAAKLFPGSTALFARKKDDGRAEALLLAFFGMKYFT